MSKNETIELTKIVKSERKEKRKELKIATVKILVFVE